MVMDSFKQFLLEFETTLKYHDSLNPAIWQDERIDAEVKKHLLKIAEEWRKFANIPTAAVKDIILTGGNANFNYTKFSDLDVHLLVDKSKIAECDKAILDDYLKDKKYLWSLNHDIKVLGFPVELYAQDLGEKTSMDQGVFSLKNNAWVKKPVKEKVNLQDPALARKVRHLKDMIDFFIDSKSTDVAKMDAFKERLRTMRGTAVQKGGEFSLENLAFKELRNQGYLDKFSDHIKKLQDKQLSLHKR
jgi:hypothetical protein